jgi:uncharacterized protein YyaL (SSP411 family)
MPNRLANEKSLYLLQHADNPVDWYPWGDEALEKARSENKPILVSIGYSSCHWCHVMAHESFEDEYIARLMNTHFICIKVDREERPDVDQIYMDAVQMLNGQGGWPLNVFCLPDGKPFAGGTYFPPNEDGGHPIVPWPQLLIRIADYYTRQKKDLEENATAIIGNLRASNTPHQLTGDALSKGDYLLAMNRLLDNQDPEFGGFGTAPKFPPAMSLDFLLAMRASATVESTFPDKADAIDAVLNRTLTGMAHGGIFDQFGGGFARYSVDQHWLIPHFEKMLYDNALLIDIYAKAYQRYPKDLYRLVVEETIGWLEREMASPNGAYFAALDADTDGEEGMTYVWNPAQIKAVLGDEEGEQICHVYGITEGGNFENSGLSNPALLSADPETRHALEGARDKLLQVRNQRPQPGRDEKCLVAWNALLITGLSRAAFTFGRRDWLDKAIGIANWVWTSMRGNDGMLASVAYGGVPSGKGNLNDYAYSAEAFLALAAVIDWASPGQSATWIERAREFAGVADRHFGDTEGLGFFFTSDQVPALVHRKKDWYDNATPAGISCLINVHGALSSLISDSLSREHMSQLSTAYPGIVNTSPAAASHALSGLVHHATGIAVIKAAKGTDLEPLRAELVKRPWRPVYIMEQEAAMPEGAYQLCIGTQCLAPTDSVESLVESI